MFKISHRQTVLRASIFGCLIVAILSIATYFITNLFNDSQAAIYPGDLVTVSQKIGTETYHYGSKDGGTYARWYAVTASDGSGYNAFCAQASLDDPRGDSKEALELANNVRNGAAIKLLAYIWQVDNSATNALRTQIYSLMSSGNWSDSGIEVQSYLFTHAVISGLYDSDYHGLNSTEQTAVQTAAFYLQEAINSNSAAWQEANQYTLFYAVPTDIDDQVVVWIAESTKFGTINVKKCDAETQNCTPQGNASFAGIPIEVRNASGKDVYNARNGVTYPDGAVMASGTLNSNGQISFNYLPADNVTYQVIETAANSTYQITAPTQKTVILSASGQVVDATFYNTVKKGSITVNKTDKETGTCTTVTDKHSFTGTSFKVVNTSTNSIYYNGSTIATGSVVTTGSIAANSCNLTFSNLPYGTYQVIETAAGTRYALDSTPTTITIPTNNQADVSFTFSNQPIRGDVTFVKKDPANNLVMGNAVFSISSIDENDQIIETHIVVANQNGVVDTRNSANRHSFNTNSYDELYDSSEEPLSFAGYGTWFGLNRSNQPVPVNNNVGALPYGTYIIQELKCDANMFCSGIINEKVTIRINSHDQVVDLGDWNNTCAQFSIETEATDKEDGDHYIEAGQDSVITDHISYCAKKNYTFTITGTLMDKSTGEPLLINGQKVEQTTEVKPTTDCGTIDMEFPINTSDLNGKSIVVFEKLYYKENLKSVHEDIDDANQTINVVSLSTIATDSNDNDKFIVEGEHTTIKDTVNYCAKNDVPYIIRGILMDKSTGGPLLINGEKVEQSVEITPTENCGTTELLFELDSANLAGKVIVVYETLYEKVSETEEHKVIAHEDIDDDAQTIGVINFSTYAVNEQTGTKLFPRDSDIKVKDTVRYCLRPGLEYTVKGIVMDKSTGEELLVNDAPVESQVTFTPTESCGEVDMFFEFNTTNLGGAKLVIFEKLYHNGKLLIEHHDLSDEDESFEIDPNAPETGYAAHVSSGTTETTHSGLLIISAVAITPVIIYSIAHFTTRKRVLFNR